MTLWQVRQSIRLGLLQSMMYRPDRDNERHRPGPSNHESHLEYCVFPACRTRTMMTMKATWMMTMEEMGREHFDAEASWSVAMRSTVLTEATSPRPAFNGSGSKHHKSKES